MSWDKIGHIADVMGIIGFFMSICSLFISGFILAAFRRQKKIYKQRREALLTSLLALRDNIWIDNLTDPRICDKLQSDLFSFRSYYWLLASPACHFHVGRCIRLLSKNDFNKYNAKIRADLNYVIGRLSVKE